MTYDYSGDYGCCLNCEKAEPGCLCYECKCTQCIHYIPPEEWDGQKGKCGLCVHTKAEKKAWAIAHAPKVSPLPSMKRQVNISPISYKNAFGNEGGVEV